jgi:hypothetical protein
LKYFLVFATISIIIIGSLTAIYLPGYLERQQKLRDRDSGCFEYRQMHQKATDSYAVNPNGAKWKRESMAAAGLLKKHRCTPQQ